MLPESLFYAIGASMVGIGILYWIAYWLAPESPSKSKYKTQLYQGGETIEPHKSRYLERTYEWISYFSIIHVIGFMFASFIVLGISNGGFNNIFVFFYLFIGLFSAVMLIEVRRKPAIRERQVKN